MSDWNMVPLEGTYNLMRSRWPANVLKYVYVVAVREGKAYYCEPSFSSVAEAPADAAFLQVYRLPWLPAVP